MLFRWSWILVIWEEESMYFTELQNTEYERSGKL